MRRLPMRDRRAFSLSSALAVALVATSAASSAAAASGARGAETRDPGARPAPAATPEPRARQRLLLTLRQDVAWASADQPCTAASQSSGEFSCFRDNGTQYLGTPRPSDAPAFEGFSAATTRLIAGYERFFGSAVSLTGMFGVVLQGGGPTPVGRDAHAFLPIHLELDGAVWPAGAPSLAGQLRPFVFFGAGIGQIDSSVAITVREDRSVRPAPTQLDNPDEQQLDVYSRYGTGFIDAGVGLELRIAGPLTTRARLLGDFTFPAQGAALGLDFGFGVDL